MKTVNILLVLVVSLCMTIISCETEPLDAIESENLTFMTSNTSRASGPSANGQGTLTLSGIDGDVRRHFSFHARTMNNGTTKGNGQLTYTKGDLKIKFDIDCMIITTNTSVFTGTITRAPQFPERVGWEFWFKVEDNGEGNNASPDQMTLFLSNPDLEDCSFNYGLAFNPIEGGNIQVKP